MNTPIGQNEQKPVKLRNAASRDPLIKAMRKAQRAHRDSAEGQLQALLKEERRWKSKETMASNKLRKVRDKIADFALQLARENDANPEGKRGSVLGRMKFVAAVKGGGQ